MVDLLCHILKTLGFSFFQNIFLLDVMHVFCFHNKASGESIGLNSNSNLYKMNHII